MPERVKRQVTPGLVGPRLAKAIDLPIQFGSSPGNRPTEPLLLQSSQTTGRAVSIRSGAIDTPDQSNPIRANATDMSNQVLSVRGKRQARSDHLQSSQTTSQVVSVQLWSGAIDTPDLVNPIRANAID